MRFEKVFFVVLTTFCCGTLNAQGTLSTDWIAAGSMKDADGNKCGRGSVMKYSARYTAPLSVRRDTAGHVTAWTATLKTDYAVLSNSNGAELVNPDRVLSASLNISHIRPVSRRWQVILSAGAGLYADPGAVTARCILANGVAIFAYRLSDRLSIGIGGGLTNSYGVPMLLPMGYLNWETKGRMKVSVDMASGLRVKATTWLTKRLQIDLTAIEMDGMSAVIHHEGKSRVYSSMMMRTMLGSSFRLSKRSAFYVGAGGNWLRSVRITDRSLKGFFSNFGDDDGKYRFDPALRLTAGFRYGF